MNKYLTLVSVLFCFTLKAETLTTINANSVNNHICIVVNDLEKEITFYRDILGFKIVDTGTRSGEGIAKILGVKNAKVRIYRALSPNGHFFVELLKYITPTLQQQTKQISVTDYGFNHFVIEVNDVDKTYELLKKSGIRTISSPVTLKESGTKAFFAYDPEGNKIEFFKLKQK